MATTTAFGWSTPDDTSLVKDGAAAIRTLGQSIDTSMAELKGGTTGQVLSKTSNTDMDFTWVAQDDSNAIQNAIVDAKGDLIAASANDTPARLAVGANGETLVADSSTSTGLGWSANFAAGKNKIINGNFAINQRAFTSTTGGVYGFDRWSSGATGGTATYSAQTFTPGTAPVTGYEAANFARMVTSGQSAAGDFAYVWQRIEDVRSFAGQTITVSLWAKASTGTPKVGISIEQFFGTGGSSAVITSTTPVTISTSWARYSVTVAIPSVTGKTIGAGSSLGIGVMTSAGTSLSAAGYPAVGVQNATIDFWGVQAEAGSVATAFQTATGTIQGELVACQRYLPAIYGGSYAGYAYATNSILYAIPFPVNARVAPTGITVTGTWTGYSLNSGSNFTPTFNLADKSGASIDSSGGRTITAGQGSRLESSGGVILFTGCEL